MSSTASLEFHDFGKRLGIEAGPADQGSVDIRLRHQIARIIRFDASSVEDPGPLGHLCPEARTKALTDRGDLRGARCRGRYGRRAELLVAAAFARIEIRLGANPNLLADHATSGVGRFFGA